jgi:hypothetical protein
MNSVHDGEGDLLDGVVHDCTVLVNRLITRGKGGRGGGRDKLSRLPVAMQRITSRLQTSTVKREYSMNSREKSRQIQMEFLDYSV